MNPLKIRLSIDLDNPTEVEALAVFTKSLNSAEPGIVKQLPKKITEKAVVKEKVVAPVAETAKDAAAPDADANEETEAPEAVIDENNPWTLEDVRKAVSDNVKTFRDEMKGKLKELGAENVVKLDPSKYVEFMSFLEELKHKK